MGKITINPGNLRKHQPGKEHITRIMYDDNEPPKNFIWGKPNGLLYVWDGENWVPLNSERAPKPPVIPEPEESISKEELEARLKQIKLEIIGYLTKLINARDCGGSDGSSAIEWFNEEVLPEINLLKTESATHATKTELAEAIAGIDTSQSITTINNNIDVINNNINTINNNVANVETSITSIEDTIDDIQDSISDINSDIVAVQNNITNVESDINALDLRLDDLEAIDHSKFVTTSEYNPATFTP